MNTWKKDSSCVVIENNDGSIAKYEKGGWGHTYHTVTKKQVEALLEGKLLAFNDGEYTHTIELEG